MDSGSVDSCWAPKGPQTAESTLMVAPISPAVVLSSGSCGVQSYTLRERSNYRLAFASGACGAFSQRTPIPGVLELQRGLQVGKKERNYKARSREVENLDHKLLGLCYGRDEKYGHICVQQLFPSLGSLG